MYFGVWIPPTKQSRAADSFGMTVSQIKDIDEHTKVQSGNVTVEQEQLEEVPYLRNLEASLSKEMFGMLGSTSGFQKWPNYKIFEVM